MNYFDALLWYLPKFFFVEKACARLFFVRTSKRTKLNERFGRYPQVVDDCKRDLVEKPFSIDLVFLAKNPVIFVSVSTRSDSA